GLENIEFEGALNPRINPRADTNVTTIQLSPWKGPTKVENRTILLQIERLVQPRIIRPLAMAHLAQPWATRAACFFQTSRLDGSSLKIRTSLRYTPLYPAQYILQDKSASSTIESFAQKPTCLSKGIETRTKPPWKE